MRVIVSIPRSYDPEPVLEAARAYGEVAPFKALRRVFVLKGLDPARLEDLRAEPWCRAVDAEKAVIQPSAVALEKVLEPLKAEDVFNAYHLHYMTQDPSRAVFRPPGRDLPRTVPIRRASTRENAIFAIVDSGVRTSHPEFDDGLNRVTQIYDAHTGDAEGAHGTTCALLVAGSISGICPKALVLDAKAFPFTGGATSVEINNGLDAVLAWVQNPANAATLGDRTVFVGCSWSGSADVFSAALDDLIDAGCIPFLSASNDSLDLGGSGNPFSVFPASEGPITIGAVLLDGRDAAFTNYGDIVEMVAPGYQIYGSDGADGYTPVNGTSFAAPLAMGAMAAWAEDQFPARSRENVLDLWHWFKLFCQEGRYGSIHTDWTGKKTGKPFARVPILDTVAGSITAAEMTLLVSYGIPTSGIAAGEVKLMVNYGVPAVGIGASEARLMVELTGLPTSPNPGAKRYWRVIVTDVQSGFAGVEDFTIVSELEFRATVGGADQTGSGTPIARSQPLSDRRAEKAFDGLTTTEWWGSDSVQDQGRNWIGYDFGAGNDVQVLQIAISSGDTQTKANQAPVEFAIQCSDDSTTWITAWGVVTTPSDWTPSETRTFTAPYAP